MVAFARITDGSENGQRKQESDLEKAINWAERVFGKMPRYCGTHHGYKIFLFFFGLFLRFC